jgi:uncharacterized protein (TIGR02246 family)
MTPRQLVELWVQAFNRADTDALAQFYTEDAVNHQVAEAPLSGRAAIRNMFAVGFASAKMTCIVENLFVDGSGPSSNGGIRWDCGDAASST